MPHPAAEKARREKNRYKARALAAEAERDEALATLARVQALIASWQASTHGPQGHGGVVSDKATADLQALLDVSQRSDHDSEPGQSR